MTNEEYRENVLKTESVKEVNLDLFTSRLLHAVMGLSTEANELLDNLKKHIFYGKELNIVNIKEEAGDSDWYMEVLLDIINETREKIHHLNINKLSKRYPGQIFKSSSAINRNTDNELSHF